MHKKIITTNEANQRLDKFLHKYLPKAGNGFIFKMLRKKNITLNGKKASGNEKIVIGDIVTFFISEETIRKFQNPSSNLNNYSEALHKVGELIILFENEHILAVDKPVGLLSQQAKVEDISLNDWLIGYLLAKNEINEDSLKTFKPSILNRLDRNTGGIVLCGKSFIGSQVVSCLLKEKKVKKYYQLIVKGKLTEAGELGGYLSKDEKANKVRVHNTNIHSTITRNCPTIENAILTKYRPLKQYSEYTLVEAELITGKTHQIRAHFASIGFPLIGDYKYGDRELNDKYKRLYGVESQLLHAYKVAFPVLEVPLHDLSEFEIISRQKFFDGML